MSERFREAFDQIHADDDLKDRTRSFLAIQTADYGRQKQLRNRRMVAAAAGFAVVFLGVSGSLTYFTPASVISVDVNPSIELDVNRFDKVISVEGYNEDGRALADSLNVRYLGYEEALDQILSSSMVAEYVAKDEQVLITVNGKNQQRNRRMMDCVETQVKTAYAYVDCAMGQPEEMADAHEAGMSCGKYRAYLELKKVEPDVTTEEVQNLTMSEIRNRIISAGGASDALPQGNHNHHGHGMGGHE